jgi:hypothetical protein
MEEVDAVPLRHIPLPGGQFIRPGDSNARAGGGHAAVHHQTLAGDVTGIGIVTLTALTSTISSVLPAGMDNISFKRHRFRPEAIRHAVWLYARFTLSYRDVEDLLAERGLDISYETLRRWFLKFGRPIARNLRHMRPQPSDYWHLDEMVIVIRGRRHWLWRAVDNEGEIFDFLVQSKRNAKAALRLMRKLLKKHGWAPTKGWTSPPPRACMVPGCPHDLRPEPPTGIASGASGGASAAILAAPNPGGQYDQTHRHPAGYPQRCRRTR